MTVADTDVLIDFLADIGPAVSILAAELARGSLRTTTITRFELLSGARSSRHEATIVQLLAAVPALALDEPAADRAAAVRRALDRAGAAIGMADSLIAGIVLRHGGRLLTRNRRHFERVPELKLVPLPAPS
jgi:predicted nucleic acid-binding protein